MAALAKLSPVTPFRKTHVVFDEQQQVVVQPAVSFERTANQMARSTSSNRTNVVLKEGIGWRVSNYADINYLLMERTSGQSSFITTSGGTFSVASGVVEANRTRKIVNADVTGIDTGSSSDLATTAAPFYRRLWGDTDDVSTLGMSTAGFNQPDTTDTSYVMDRIGESVNQYTSEDDFFIIFDVPGTKHATPQAVASFYFPGPAGQTGLTSKSIPNAVEATYSTGRGEYCLKFYGDGKAELFERLTTGSPYTWIGRTMFNYATSGNVFGNIHFCTITSTTIYGYNGGTGGTISFRMGTNKGLDNAYLDGGVIATTVRQATDHRSGQTQVYKVPNASGTPVASNACNLRVDIRRDLRGVEFCLGVPKYLTSGTLRCDKFKHGGLSITTGVSTDHPYVLQWDADIPTAGIGGTGAAVDLKLYSAITNAEISTPVVVNSYTKNYPLPTNFEDMLYVVATLTSSTSKTKSPTLKSYKVYRDALYSTTTTTGTDFVTDSSGGSTVLTRVISEFRMSGAERDISHEMASISGADLLGTYTPLRIRSGIPVNVWTEYDPADATKKFYLFDGYINPTDTVPIPGNGFFKIPAADAYTFDLQANGKWQRLKENNFTVTQQFFCEPDTKMPFRVTELVKTLLAQNGFDSTQYDIPDSPIRIAGKGGDVLFSTSPVTDMLTSLQDMLYSYLGWFLVWDRNIGTSGKWRALPQVRAPYTNVAAFITGGPPQVDGSTRMTHNVKSYPLASTLADGFTYTATAPVIPISKGTIIDQVLPPEGNFLYVSTAHTGENPDGPNDPLTQVAFNPVSFDFDPLNPTADTSSPDYLGRMVPIYYFIPSIAGTANNPLLQLQTITKRIYDIACHATFKRDFEAPIVPLTHESDATKVRNLRYYDPVTVDGVQYIIRNVNPRIEKDVAQMQMIQVEKPNF